MRTIEVLMDEHRLIEDVVSGVEAFARRLREGAAPNEKATLAKVVRFLSDYVDHFHHGKEEGILFAAAVDAGMPMQRGVLARMNVEHDDGRRLITTLSELVEPDAAWTQEERGRIAECALSVASFLRCHAHEEDHTVFGAMAVQLSAEAKTEADEALAKMEAEPEYQERREELTRLGRDIAGLDTGRA